MQADYLDKPHYGNAGSDFFLSVIVPAFNEKDVLPEFHKRLANVLASMALKSEILYVNDGSSDTTLKVMKDLRKQDPSIGIIDLSRNFGKEIALTAGIDHSKGDAVIVIDADLQDPPEVIPELVRHWMEGYDVVYGKRISREGESIFKKATAHIFYRLIQHIGNVTLPEDTGDFRLLSRRAVEALKSLREHHRFMKGLFTWIGFSQKAVNYHRHPRYKGLTKWNYWRLWNFALEGITSFTIAPLKVASYIGLTTALGAFVYGVFIIYRTLVFGDPVRGYPSLVVIVLFLGGIQLLSLGLIGEYIGRIFNETKRRPLYFINMHLPSFPASHSIE